MLWTASRRMESLRERGQSLRLNVVTLSQAHTADADPIADHSMAMTRTIGTHTHNVIRRGGRFACSTRLSSATQFCMPAIPPVASLRDPDRTQLSQVGYPSQINSVALSVPTVAVFTSATESRYRLDL